jgi:RNA polymerase sigma-70 factor (ECF subfamily)
MTEARAGLAPALCDRSTLAYPRGMVTTPLEDSALMLRYKDGDTAAFEELYRRHNDALYRYFLRMGGDRTAAEDLYQEAWTKIIRARSTYQPTAKFTTFLYRVAHNCFIDYLRRNERHRRSSDVEPDAQPAPGDSPDMVAESQLARERLETALKTLPDEQRDAFLLHEEAGLSVDDIAKVTGANRETAKSRLRYAVKKLRAAIDEPEIAT